MRRPDQLRPSEQGLEGQPLPPTKRTIHTTQDVCANEDDDNPSRRQEKKTPRLWAEPLDEHVECEVNGGSVNHRCLLISPVQIRL